MARAHAAQPLHRGEGFATQQTEPARPRDKAVAAALFVALAVIALVVAAMGVSGMYAQMAQFETERASSTAALIGEQQVARIEQRLYSSLRFASGNPWTLEQMGALNLAKMRASTVPREAVALTRDARTRFRQALHQRPTSPFVWANLALAKLYLDEIDAEFFGALRHAEELGPWEPAVQQVTVFVGLATWQELDSGMRRRLVRTLERGALGNAENLARIARSFRRFDLVCGIKKYNTILGSQCRNSP